MAGSVPDSYQPTVEMYPIINAQYNMAKLAVGSQNSDLMRVNRIKLLVIASKAPYYAVTRAIRSANNQLSQIVGDVYKSQAQELINQLESIK